MLRQIIADPVNTTLNSVCVLLLSVGFWDRRMMSKRVHSLEDRIDRYTQHLLENKQ